MPKTPPAKSTNPLRNSDGISLLEMMVVLAVIALILGLVTPRVLGYFERAKAQTAQLQLTHIRSALQLMYIDLERYPSEDEGLDALLVAPIGTEGWRGPYLDDPKGLLDPWGRAYVYRFPGDNKAFDLISLGRDGQIGGDGDDADITN